MMAQVKVRLKLLSGDDELSVERNVGQASFDENEKDFILLDIGDSSITLNRRNTRKLVSWLQDALAEAEEMDIKSEDDEEEEPEVSDDESEEDEFESDEDETDEEVETNEEKEVKE